MAMAAVPAQATLSRSTEVQVGAAVPEAPWVWIPWPALLLSLSDPLLSYISVLSQCTQGTAIMLCFARGQQAAAAMRRDCGIWPYKCPIYRQVAAAGL